MFYLSVICLCTKQEILKNKEEITMRKKILSVTLCVLLACSLFAVNTGAAGNISDKYEKLNLKPSTLVYTPQFRQKYDTTSAYQRCVSASGLTYYSRVYGMQTDGKKYDASKGNVYTFRAGTTYYMTNFVRENYNNNPSFFTNYAGMACASTGTGGIYSFPIEFYWSPDSI